MAYILRADHGLDLPRPLQVEFSKIAQERMDADGKELTSPELWALFRQAYLLDNPPMTLLKQQTVPTSPDNRELVATLRKADGSTMTIEGEGNGPIDAFVDALKKAFKVEFSFIDYHEHAVGRGANATAASYVEIQDAEGRAVHGVGMDPNIVMASLKATLGAVLEADAAGGQGGLDRHREPSLRAEGEAIHPPSRGRDAPPVPLAKRRMDCFVAALLAMTGRV